MAEKLVITTNTVKRHLKAIFEKLNFHTRSAATAKVARGYQNWSTWHPTRGVYPDWRSRVEGLGDDVNVRPKAGPNAKHPC
jgi:regulatory LuxR family protein